MGCTATLLLLQHSLLSGCQVAGGRSADRTTSICEPDSSVLELKVKEWGAMNDPPCYFWGRSDQINPHLWALWRLLWKGGLQTAADSCKDIFILTSPSAPMHTDARVWMLAVHILLTRAKAWGLLTPTNSVFFSTLTQLRVMHVSYSLNFSSLPFW